MSSQIKTITKKDGSNYSVRNDRSRFFYPQEWLNFIKTFKSKGEKRMKIKPKLSEKKEVCFWCLLWTGSRINEVSHIKVMDFDFKRLLLRLVVTKTKAKKGEKQGKPRTIRVPEIMIKRIKKYIRESDKILSDYVFMDKDNPTDKDFDNFNKNMYQTMMRHLKQANLDEKEFGLHNIRKTTGNYLKAQGVSAEEICIILGHDFDTYLKHYGSPNVFDRTDLTMMESLFGREFFEALRGNRR